MCISISDYHTHTYIIIHEHTVSVIKKLKYSTVLYSTFSELRVYFKRTTNRAAHAQFGSVHFDSVRYAVRCGTTAVIRAFQLGIDPESDRGLPNSTWRPFLSRCHNNFVNRVTTLREIENACQ